MTESSSASIVEVRSSTRISVPEAFEQWEDMMSSTLVPVSLAPVQRERFFGRAVNTDFDTFGLSTFHSSGQLARRSARHVARSENEFLMAILMTKGGGYIEQGGRTVQTTPGSLVLLPTGSPYTYIIDAQPAAAVVVQMPFGRVLDYTGLSPDRLSTTLTTPTDGAAGVVAQFFHSLAELQSADPDQAATLATHGTGLLASAVSLAVGEIPGIDTARDLNWQRVLTFLRTRYPDPELTVDEIARACLLSRRSLYRLCAHLDGGVAALLRRIRIDRAQDLLRTNPSASLARIALACGFTTERHFYRVFRQETGMTPGEFRARNRGNTTAFADR